MARAGGILLVMALLWDLGGQDMAVMHWWGDASGFALRHHPWLERYAHDGVRRLLVAVLLIGLVVLALPSLQTGRLQRDGNRQQNQCEGKLEEFVDDEQTGRRHTCAIGRRCHQSQREQKIG